MAQIVARFVHKLNGKKAIIYDFDEYFFSSFRELPEDFDPDTTPGEKYSKSFYPNLVDLSAALADGQFIPDRLEDDLSKIDERYYTKQETTGIAIAMAIALG